ncbi:hypothetical protein K7432_018038 [Basidiobolus ranarum]|uniref:Uncharacterized protein n=1 Tax=Basidiobolus ranarum TaxID=34480 RepID=A0ABR2VJJ6_9FUNG
MSTVEYLYKYVHTNHRANVNINPNANPVNDSALAAANEPAPGMDKILQFQVVVLGEDFHQVLHVVLRGLCRQTEAEDFIH